MWLNLSNFDSLNGFSSHSPSPPQAHTLFCPLPFIDFFPLSFSFVLELRLGKLRVWPAAVQVCIATKDVSMLKGEWHASFTPPTPPGCWGRAGSPGFASPIFCSNLKILELISIQTAMWKQFHLSFDFWLTECSHFNLCSWSSLPGVVSWTSVCDNDSDRSSPGTTVMTQLPAAHQPHLLVDSSSLESDFVGVSSIPFWSHNSSLFVFLPQHSKMTVKSFLNISSQHFTCEI